MMLRAAWKMETEGPKGARADASAIKIVAARLQTHVTDRAMPVFGDAGIMPATPLSFPWTWGRALRFVDGPDEVHNMAVARDELRRASTGRIAFHYVSAH
jgi:acyl-CoA dehydrogenase